MRERGEVFDCFSHGGTLSEKVAEALRQKILELAEKAQERNTP